MCRKFAEDELNRMNHKDKDAVIYQLQDRLDKLEHDYENLMEQIRLANQQRYGRHTESLTAIAGQREEDIKDFPQEEISHDISASELIETFGEGNYKSMPDEICWRLRFEPAKWIAEKHIIKVYVGTDGVHQDELINIIRGAQASAIIYSITETARANNLNVYYYIKHLLTEMPKYVDKNENISRAILDPLMPWSKNLPADCYSKRRK